VRALYQSVRFIEPHEVNANDEGSAASVRRSSAGVPPTPVRPLVASGKRGLLQDAVCSVYPAGVANVDSPAGSHNEGVLEAKRFLSVMAVADYIVSGNVRMDMSSLVPSKRVPGQWSRVQGQMGFGGGSLQSSDGHRLTVLLHRPDDGGRCPAHRHSGGYQSSTSFNDNISDSWPRASYSTVSSLAATRGN